MTLQPAAAFGWLSTNPTFFDYVSMILISNGSMFCFHVFRVEQNFPHRFTAQLRHHLQLVDNLNPTQEVKPTEADFLYFAKF